jgi:hypothetical protein
MKKQGGKIRNRQCIGLATASDPAGPFVRTKTPVVEPHGHFKNVAVNPAVVFRDGKFVMIVKGDDVRKKGWFRVQFVGHSERAEGPFVFQDTPIYDKAQTEDACLWYDSEDGLYHSIFHVLGRRDLVHIISKDSVAWREATPFVALKKQFTLDDGSIWKPYRVERPFVLADAKGRAEWIYLAVLDKGGSGNIASRIRK